MARTDDPHPLIHRLRASGMPDDVIFHRLMIEGWASEDIQHAFAERGNATPSALLPAPEEKTQLPAHAQEVVSEGSPTPPARMLSPLSLGVVAVATGLIVAAVGLYVRPPVVYSISIQQGAAASSTPDLSYGALPALADPQYYSSVRLSLMEQKVSFIDANLSSMQLVVYKDGELALSVPILAKGKPGSWWETPAGVYKIETKERNHFSSFGQVQMPYSLDFQGNFFIHGWPMYPDGTPVSSAFSGGCIRLSTEDAEKVYALAAVGEPVVVHNEEPARAPFDYTLKAPLAVSAAEYLVADLETGAVLSQRAASESAPIASITKLVTALVATEYINLDKMLSVPSSALVYTAVPRLKVGASVRAYDLLFLLLQESSNEASETLAATVGREQFIVNMNKKAKAIGLSHTTFNDPSGAKDDISTPTDLFTLLRYIAANRSFVFDITSGDIADSAYGAPAFRNINNFNIVKKAPAELIGGKIGQTNEAGETYAGIFAVKVGGVERKLAVIVLGSRDAQADVSRLLNFVHSSYAPAQ